MFSIMTGTCDSSPEKFTTDYLSVLSSNRVGMTQSTLEVFLIHSLTTTCIHDQAMNTISMIQSGKKVKSSPATLLLWSIGQVMFMLYFSF
jgi:hypothetical protein